MNLNKSKTKDSKKKKNVSQNQNAQTDDISQTETKENAHRDDQKTNTTIQQMVDIWKNIFPTSPVQLTKDLSRFLYAAYKNKFDSDLNLWKHYCQTIETSSYLTSENFKLHLSWAISFKTIDRIKVGELGVKSIPVEGEKEKLEHEIMTEISQLSESDECKQMRFNIMKIHGVYSYHAWLRTVILFEYDGEIYFKAQTDFAQSYIEKDFGQFIKNPSKTILEKREQHLIQKDEEISVQKESKIAATGQTEGERDTPLAEETRAILEEIERLEEEDICKMIRSVILKLHDVETYVSLLRPANLSIENGLLKVDTFSDLHQEQITNILDNLPFLDNFKL